MPICGAFVARYRTALPILSGMPCLQFPFPVLMCTCSAICSDADAAVPTTDGGWYLQKTNYMIQLYSCNHSCVWITLFCVLSLLSDCGLCVCSIQLFPCLCSILPFSAANFTTLLHFLPINYMRRWTVMQIPLLSYRCLYSHSQLTCLAAKQRQFQICSERSALRAQKKFCLKLLI